MLRFPIVNVFHDLNVIFFSVEPFPLILVEIAEVVDGDILFALSPTNADAFGTDFGGSTDIDDSREWIGEAFHVGIPEFVEVPFHEIHFSVVMKHFGKDEEVRFKAPFGDEDIVFGDFRIFSGGILPVINLLFDIHGAGEKGTVLEGVGPTFLIFVEVFEEIRAIGRFEGDPLTDGFIDKVPGGMGFLEGINEGCFPCADVTFNTDKNGLRNGRGHCERMC